MIAKYLLPSVSWGTFAPQLTTHIKRVTLAEALDIVDARTEIVTTSPAFDDMLRGLFPMISGDTLPTGGFRLGQDEVAVGVQYRGPRLVEGGDIPPEGKVSFFLIEADEYHEV